MGDVLKRVPWHGKGGIHSVQPPDVPSLPQAPSSTDRTAGSYRASIATKPPPEEPRRDSAHAFASLSALL